MNCPPAPLSYSPFLRPIKYALALITTIWPQIHKTMRPLLDATHVTIVILVCVCLLPLLCLWASSVSRLSSACELNKCLVIRERTVDIKRQLLAIAFSWSIRLIRVIHVIRLIHSPHLLQATAPLASRSFPLREVSNEQHLSYTNIIFNL